MVLPAVLVSGARVGAQAFARSAQATGRVAGGVAKKGASVAGRVVRRGATKGVQQGVRGAGQAARQGVRAGGATGRRTALRVGGATGRRGAIRAGGARTGNPAAQARRAAHRNPVRRQGRRRDPTRRVRDHLDRDDDRRDRGGGRAGPPPRRAQRLQGALDRAGSPTNPDAGGGGRGSAAAGAGVGVGAGSAGLRQRAKRGFQRVRNARKRFRKLRKRVPKAPGAKARRWVRRIALVLLCTLLLLTCQSSFTAADDDEQQQRTDQESMVTALSLLCGGGAFGGQLGTATVTDPDGGDGGGAAPPADDGTPTIMGPAELTGQQVKAWWDRTRGNQPSRLGVPIDQLIDLYLSEGQAEGVRGDYALAQAVLETGSFANGDTEIHNYAGIGNTASRTWGISFPNPAAGVRAHVQLLKKFAQGNGARMAHPDVAPDAGARASTFGQLTDTWAGDDAAYWRNLQSIHAEMGGRGGGSSGNDPPSPAGTSDPSAAGANPLCPTGAGTGTLCPVQGDVAFGNDFNSPREDGSPITGGAGPHGAIDMMAPRGTPVIAHVDGTIQQLGGSNLGGNRYHLRAADGTVWYGAHLDRFVPRTGQVRAGELIGYVGNTGAPGAPTHLHVEMWPGGERSQAQNPYTLLRELCSAPAPGQVGGSRTERTANGRNIQVVELRDPTGTTVTVNASIAGKIQAMFQAAQRDGVTLSVSSSFRSAAKQIEIWERHNCANRADQCAGEVARPGSSNHELGLALDFNDCASTGTACNRWMRANGARYGMYHDPGWGSDLLHWSTNGH
jgi:murein DD-endopeptidase MepM/ murein hydrolase activator NlpD